MASRMGLVQGDLVGGKRHFSSVLKHAYLQDVTVETISAAIRKAGIFPLDRKAVDSTMLVPAPNPLVRSGIIPEGLAHILQAPQFNRSPEKATSSTCNSHHE
ncbi:hypothetical protein SKAU_G00194980 [Synaphobranchus kaupii]|uniref:Uncharacterized protein n=1 Tax=Synaphobranchus kaupii TaxID=118154 RepID=A0A9Q1FED8_SYNKA|nr:hypothetical protein SKAU_G00194980 [Synaphobranchus kaupii]